MVVPPDLPRSEVGAGPIVVATDLTRDSVPAAKFAHALGRNLGREVLALHVTDAALTEHAASLPTEMLPSDPLPLVTVEGVEAFLRALDLDAVKARIERGDIVDTLLIVAEEVDAPVIICGSRRLSTTERVFRSSVGTDLARLATRAVAVVPPPE